MAVVFLIRPSTMLPGHQTANTRAHYRSENHLEERCGLNGCPGGILNQSIPNLPRSGTRGAIHTLLRNQLLAAIDLVARSP